MGNPAAVMWDKIIGTDKHIIITSSGASITVPLQFNGMIEEKCSTNVLICGKPAAVQGSTGNNIPPHIPTGGRFGIPPPDNKAEITSGSETVLINNKPAARSGDSAKSCDDTGGGNSMVNGSASSVLIG